MSAHHSRNLPPNQGGASRVRPRLPFDGTPAEDPRIEVYRRWLAAHDRHDTSAASRAVIELRSLGVSVCPAAGGRR